MKTTVNKRLLSDLHLVPNKHYAIYYYNMYNIVFYKLINTLKITNLKHG